MDLKAETARAYAAFSVGDHETAAKLADRVLGVIPDDAGALTLSGRLALAGGDPEAARGVFQRLVEEYPRVAALWLDLALALRNLGRPAQALTCIERSLSQAGGTAVAWTLRGEILLSMGRRRDAARAFRRALDLAPGDTAAFRGLGNAGDLTLGSEVVSRMAAAVHAGSLPAREAARVHYTLAQAHRQAGHDDQFIRHLLSANALQRSLSAAGEAEYDAIFDDLERTFDAAAMSRAAVARPVEPVPIFILGMPRSGTTLVERLLACDASVGPGGEIDYVRGPLRRQWQQRFGRPFPVGFDTLSSEQLSMMTRSYARRLGQAAPGKARVTDKTPGNFHVLGLLRVLFPEARIVHLDRDPMDTCFSILQQPFDDASPHTCDMKLLAHVYGRYQRLMERWRELLGDGFISIRYEQLVASPAEEGARLFRYCHLHWVDDYLESFRHGEAVRTFSATQVRRRVYTGSVGAWQRYADHLAPLRQALQPHLQET